MISSIKKFGIACVLMVGCMFAHPTQAAVTCTGTLNLTNQINFGTLNLLGIIELPTNAIAYTCTGNLLVTETYSLCISFNTPGAVPFAITNGSSTIPVTLAVNGSTISPNTTAIQGAGTVLVGLPTVGAATLSAKATVSGPVASGTYTGNFTMQLTYRYGTVLNPPSSCTTGGTGGGQTNVNVSVTGTVNPSCTVTANSINFGTVNTTSTNNVTATGSMQLNCTINTPLSATLTSANVASNTYNLVGNSQGTVRTIPYRFYQDVGLTQAWLPTTTVNKNSGSTGTLVVPLYAQILSTNYRGLVGTFSDNVTVNITY